MISNATAQWWFSSGEMSLYLMASSVLAFTCDKYGKKMMKYMGAEVRFGSPLEHV